MPRKGYAVTIATLLLLAQLLLGVTARALPTADTSGHCPGCPTTAASMMHGGGHDMGGHGCGTHVPAGGSHCGHHCAVTSGHCGTSASPALDSLALHAPLVAQRTSWMAARDARLPDSPLFDFLRPPN